VHALFFSYKVFYGFNEDEVTKTSARTAKKLRQDEKMT
jgi:hypothetical protein